MTQDLESFYVSKKDYESLVLGTMRAAFLYAKTCCRGKIPDDEIFSHCYDALSKAVKNFKLGGNLRFFGYSKPYIRGALSKFWREADMLPKMERIGYDFNSGPTSDYQKETDNPFEIFFVPSRKNDPEMMIDDRTAERITIKERWDIIRPIIQKCLTAKEQAILELMFVSGFNGVETAKLIGVSYQFVYKSQKRAVKKIRAELERQRKLHKA